VGTVDTNRECPVNCHTRVTSDFYCKCLGIHTIMLNGLKFSKTCSHDIRRSSSGPKNIKNNIQCAKSHTVSVVSCHKTRHYVTITPHKWNKAHKHTMEPFLPSSPRKLQQFCSSAMITYNHSGLSLQNMVRLKDYVIIIVFKFNFKYICIHTHTHTHTHTQGGDDKSLARPTSRNRRTGLIVSLERGVCHVPNCKSLLSCLLPWII